MKYMGSKSRIAKHIVPIIQKCIDDNSIKTYIEPFVGGANIIDKIRCNEKLGFDKNKYLIALLKRVQEKGNLLDCVSKEQYNLIRTAFNNKNTENYPDWIVGNVGFLASYNGRWFDGGYAKSGYEKTKNGERFRDYYKESKNNLINQAPDLKNCSFFTCEYTKLMQNTKITKAVIYCDPPYQNTKEYKNAKKFDYDLFWETMRKWSKDNICIISEQDAPSDFKCIWEQEVSRSIKASEKSKSVEKLFIYSL